MGSAYIHGWTSLPTMGEMFLEHGVPLAARVSGGEMVDLEHLVREVAEVSGLHVTVGQWQPLEGSDDMEATLHVDAREIAEVLRRLAQASAKTFYDRYHKPIDAGDTDYDDEAYAQDFGIALSVCGLRWDQAQADQSALRDKYSAALREAAKEIALHPLQ